MNNCYKDYPASVFITANKIETKDLLIFMGLHNILDKKIADILKRGRNYVWVYKDSLTEQIDIPENRLQNIFNVFDTESVQIELEVLCSAYRENSFSFAPEDEERNVEAIWLTPYRENSIQVSETMIPFFEIQFNNHIFDFELPSDVWINNPEEIYDRF